MVLRVVFVTLLLGSAIFVNVNDVRSFTNPTYIAIASLIIGTYLATIAYALLLGRVNPRKLAYVQLMGDVAVATGLIVLTGGAHSIFTFLFYVSIVNGAIILGNSGSFTVATVSSLVLVALLNQSLAFTQQPAPPPISPLPIYNVVINILAFYLVGFLAGRLAARIEEQQSSVADLEALNADILSSIASGVITLDEDCNIVSLNHAAKVLLEAKLEGDVLGPEWPDRFCRLIDTGGQRLELGGHPVDDEPWIEVSHSPLHDGAGRQYGHILVLRDLTTNKQLERQMLRQRGLAAVGTLAAGIAHEIRNPLASMSGSIELLKNMPAGGEAGEALMNIVLREVDRLNFLITDFLAFARETPRDAVPIDLTKVIVETVELFAQDETWAGRILVELELEPITNAQPLGDVHGLTQVFWNLLRNSAEAIEGEGTIVVSATLTGESNVKISVADDGPGIAASDLDRIFEPFYTTKVSGTGLGLATVSRIVADLGGLITARNHGSGAVFEVILRCGDTDLLHTAQRAQTNKLSARRP